MQPLRFLLPALWLLLTAAAAAEPLRMGVFPRLPQAETLERFAPLAAWLGRALGREVVLESAPDMPAFWEKVRAGRFDLVHYNPHHYIRARRRLGHRVLVRNQEQGRSEIRPAILVPGDSPIRDIRELRGARILFGGGHGALVAHRLARALLHAHGLRPGDYLETRAGTPVDAMRALYFGQADAATGCDTLHDVDLPRQHRHRPPPRVLALGEPIPHLPWAVSGDVDEHEAARIRAALLRAHRSRDGRRALARARLTALVATRDADYDRVRRLLESLRERDE